MALDDGLPARGCGVRVGGRQRVDALEADVDDLLAGEQPFRLLEDRAVALAEADGAEQAVALQGVVDLEGGLHVEGLRFLAEQVGSFFGRGDLDRGAHRGRHHRPQGVEGFLFHHFEAVGVGRRDVEFRGRGPGLAAVDVADGDDLRPRDGFQVGKMLGDRVCAGAVHADAHPVGSSHDRSCPFVLRRAAISGRPSRRRERSRRP